MDILNISKTLRLRADWFKNEDYRKGGFPAELIRPLSVELIEAADIIEALKAENSRFRALAEDWKYRQSCNNQDLQTPYAKAKAHIYGICANELQVAADGGKGGGQ